MAMQAIITWSFFLLTVSLAQYQYNRPQTPPDFPTYKYVFENETVGSEILTLQAKDLDADDNITFKANTVDTEHLVSLGKTDVNTTTHLWTCPVSLKEKLDRDNSPTTRQLFFEAKDKAGQTVEIRVLLIIGDVNDNPPNFVNLPYRTSIPEDLAVGEWVYRVTAEDPDSNLGGSVIFMMEANVETDNADYRKTFSLQEHSGNITLTKTLDYERRSFYHIKMSAVDEGVPPCPGQSCQCEHTDPTHCKPDKVDLFITIIDVQDTPPVFERLPYMGAVAEDKAVGHSVLQVTAADGDRGVATPNDVVFSLSGGDATLFSINESNGIISVAEVLDADSEEAREKGNLYVFNVTATEVLPGHTSSAIVKNSTHSTTTQVSITVTDVNDESPTFSNNTFHAMVQENTPKGVPLSMTSTIEVFDNDQGINSAFELYLEKDGAVYTDFETLPPSGQRIQGRSSITIIVNNSSILDYEKTKSLSFKIIAKEVASTGSTAIPSSAIVSLTIQDINDNSPQFSKIEPRFNVSENASVGHVIVTVTATDPDSGDFGKVVFTLEDDGHDGEFNISESGFIKVAKCLDRERRSSYTLVAVATDNPSAPEAQQRQSRLRIEISVTDVNDHSPSWTQYIPSVSVLESASIGTKISDLRATDLDEGRNSQLNYSITPGTNGSELFDVRGKVDSVELVIKKSLIGFSGQRIVEIEATDMGIPSLNSTVQISVLVIDENQHRPVFIKPDESQFNITIGSIPEIEMYEEVPIGTIIYNLSAIDADSGLNGIVHYYLEPTINTKDYEHFKVDRINGSLISAARLDREEKETYEIQVRGEDNGQPASLSTTLTMRLKLKDIDDNDPSFNSSEKPFNMNVIEENATAVVGCVQPPNDKDSDPANKVLCYYLYGGEEQSVLTLNKTSGELTLLKKLDRETTPEVDFVVKVSKNCSLILDGSNVTYDTTIGTQSDRPPSYNSSDNSLLWVKITVDDINDNPPKFIDKDLSAGVLYDVDIGTEVLSLSASIADADTPANSKNTFELQHITPELEIGDNLDTSKPAFLLKNGTIVTNIRFSSDLLGHFNLDVRAYDMDGLEDNAMIKIFLISNLQRVKLVFNALPKEVEALKHQFLKDLSDILNLNLVIDKIQTHIKLDGTKDPTKTDAYIHGRYHDSNEVVPASELWRVFDFNQAAREVLFRNGVAEAQTLDKKEEEDDTEELRRIFAILLSVLCVIVVALVLVLVHMVRLYRRRLRAATTMAYTSTAEKEMYEHPGTNKYFAAENPLFGKEIKQTVLDEERTSRNSLDVNAVDTPAPHNPSATEPNEEQEMVLQISDAADISPSHVKDVNHNANLDQVLQAYNNGGFEDDEDEDVARNGLKRSSSYYNYIPGVGQDVQEGVTRFSDEILSSDSGFPDGYSQGQTHLEYTDI